MKKSNKSEHEAIYRTLDEVFKLIDERHGYYPTDVFRPAEPGKPFATQDGAAAAMARFTCMQIRKDVMSLKNEIYAEQMSLERGPTRKL